MPYTDLVMDALAELADPAYQERVWTGRSPGEMSSFVECLEFLFDDSGLAVALDRGAVFGPEIDAQLRTLAELARQIGRDTEPFERLAADPRFIECRRIAGAVHARLST
ncbi:hypothetical protein [Microlunatus speluncae]|uniref:hypothetical protein n=1 Tax=Microlunatus speluncae TaxID=2594267 RepID=UPI0012662045|nr:hypothetical protein [Microlunatus speluncae]